MHTHIKRKRRGEVKYKNSVAIVRMRKNMIVGCFMIANYKYMKYNPTQFVYDNAYKCKEFDICETVDGRVIIKTKDKLENSKANITNTIVCDNVTEIEILTHYEY